MHSTPLTAHTGPTQSSWRRCLAACALLLTACGGGGSESPVQPTRSFALSATAVQAVSGASQFYQLTPGAFSFASLADDVDVLTVFIEHYGIPWDEFAVADAPPESHPWTVTMRAFAAAARATGKPLLLQSVLARDRLAGRARSVGGVLSVDDQWQAPCFDFGTSPDGPRYRAAYRRYAVWIAALFEPRALVSGVEISVYRKACASDSAWASLVATANETYDAVKALRPALQVFPSFVLADVYAGSATGYDSAFFGQFDVLKRDRLGLSIYPQGMLGAGGQPRALPADFFRRVRDRRPTEPPIQITETGWNSDTLALGSTTANCTAALPSSETMARDYLDVLLNRAAADGIELVTWWSDRDLLPAEQMAACHPTAAPPSYAACNGQAWCITVNAFRAAWPGGAVQGELLFKVFGTMGLRRYDGTPKPLLMQRWRETLAQPYRVS
jgi:hypothetical protein